MFQRNYIKVNCPETAIRTGLGEIEVGVAKRKVLLGTDILSYRWCNMLILSFESKREVAYSV